MEAGARTGKAPSRNEFSTPDALASSVMPVNKALPQNGPIALIPLQCPACFPTFFFLLLSLTCHEPRNAGSQPDQADLQPTAHLTPHGDAVECTPYNRDDKDRVPGNDLTVYKPASSAWEAGGWALLYDGPERATAPT